MDGLLIFKVVALVGFGLIIGSFLSVCIYRIPLSRNLDAEGDGDAPAVSKTNADAPDEKPRITLNSPRRSFCPKCNAQLRWYHNIPLFSWIAQRGKCAFCSEPISVRYPVVELLAAFFAVLSAKVFGLTPTGGVVFLFCCALVVISFIDYDYYIIPNEISISGFFLGMIVGTFNQFAQIFVAPVSQSILSSFIGVLAGAGFLLIVSEFYLKVRKIEGLGMGDVKLLAMTGAFFGPEAALYTIFVGSLVGSILGLTLILFAGRGMGQQLPFGPYLSVATALYLFTGSELVYILNEFIRGLLG